jgi:hypothetical protein
MLPCTESCNGKNAGKLRHKQSYHALFRCIFNHDRIDVVFSKNLLHGQCFHAVTMVLVMAMALRAGNPKIALIEIPFLVMPLVF